MSRLSRAMADATADTSTVANIWDATRRALSHRAVRVGEHAAWELLREQLAQVKRHTLDRLDHYLTQLESALVARGATVHWAADAASARRIIVELARRKGVRRVVKSKSMAGEEIHLNAALEAVGIEAVETDLGEYIVQLRGEPPAHIIAPAMHLSRAQVGDLFADRLGADRTADAEALTAVARTALRGPFTTATMGFSGVNVAVAETGTLVIVENEGNARLATGLPGLHVALMGIEKLVPRLADLGPLLTLLPQSATGQRLTVYAHHLSGSPDTELHVVLLDNGRTRLLAEPERRELLACIRCGACLNTCPVYRSVGGHAYGWTYGGPIGAALSPWLRGAAGHRLPFASSLCGACTQICPVKIDLHHHLLAARHSVPTPWPRRLLYRGFGWLMRDARRYRLAGRVARRGMALWTLLGLLRPWTRARTLPAPPRRTFAELWRDRLSSEQPGD